MTITSHLVKKITLTKRYFWLMYEILGTDVEWLPLLGLHKLPIKEDFDYFPKICRWREKFGFPGFSKLGMK